jgi:predicted DNA-binding transcriptional regulator YafY
VPLAGRAETALSKIERTLPGERVRQLRRFMRNVLVGDPAPAAAGTVARPVDPGLLEAFERAFSNGYVMQLDYIDRDGRASSRLAEPHAILVRAPLCYVIAWDQAKDAARLFRMDRINAAKVLDQQTFDRRPLNLVLGVCPDARAPAAGPARSR